MFQWESVKGRAVNRKTVGQKKNQGKVQQLRCNQYLGQPDITVCNETNYEGGQCEKQMDDWI